MTEQQQAILALFNTKDAANMEIAQECAIQVGLGKWFNRYINKQIAKVRRILNSDCSVDICIYRDDKGYDFCINGKYRLSFLCSALVLFVFNAHNVDGFWCEKVVFNNADYFLQPTFSYKNALLIERLQAENVLFNK